MGLSLCLKNSPVILWKKESAIETKALKQFLAYKNVLYNISKVLRNPIYRKWPFRAMFQVLMFFSYSIT